MMTNWVTTTLGEATENYDALRKPVRGTDRKAGQYPYYGASGIVDYVDGYIFDGEYLLIAEDGENLRTRKTPIAFMASGRYWVNNHAHVVRGNHLTDTRYLCFLLQLTDISGYLSGSTMPKLTQGNMNQIRIKLPSLAEQKSIASVLNALEEKIGNNRRMNETLEEMARAIFKSWFVDFDPVHAKAEGKQPAHMDAETAALFPSSFGESGLPDDWKTAQLHEICDIKSGKRPPTKLAKADAENTIPVYGGNGIAWYTNEILFEHPFIITGRVGTLGTVYRVYEKCWASDNALCCFPTRDDFFEFIYFTMKEIDYTSLNSGSTQPLLTQTSLKGQSFISCSEKIVLAFHMTVNKLLIKIIANEYESNTLSSLRDILLPKLMSGEIRIKDAEKAASETV